MGREATKVLHFAGARVRKHSTSLRAYHLLGPMVADPLRQQGMYSLLSADQMWTSSQWPLGGPHHWCLLQLLAKFVNPHLQSAPHWAWRLCCGVDPPSSGRSTRTPSPTSRACWSSSCPGSAPPSPQVTSVALILILPLCDTLGLRPSPRVPFLLFLLPVDLMHALQ